MTRLPETAPQPTTVIPQFTEAQLQAPWRVVHTDARVDPEIVKTYIQEIVSLTQPLFSPEVAARGNAHKTATQMNIFDHSPLEEPGDEPKRRLWDIEHTYGDDGILETLELSTGGQFQQIRIQPRTGVISYFGTHSDEEGKKVLSEKRNHPLWVEYTRRKVAELVAAATATKPNNPKTQPLDIDGAPQQNTEFGLLDAPPWRGNPA